MSSSSVMFVIVRSHISSKRLEYRERRAKEASQEHGGYKGQVDLVSEREREQNGNHYSQSSARSGRSQHSSRDRQRSRHPSPCSNSVNDLSFCLFLLELMHLLMFLKSRFTIVTIHCILAMRWSRNQLFFHLIFTHWLQKWLFVDWLRVMNRISCTSKESCFLSENVLPCLSSVTHTMVALCRCLAMNLNLLLPPWPGVGVRITRPPFINPPSLNEWMMRTGLILTGVWWWWWCTPEKSSQEKNQEYWGWWGGSPGLSQWRHAKSKMYRTQTFLYITVCSVSISGTIQPTLGGYKGTFEDF